MTGMTIAGNNDAARAERLLDLLAQTEAALARLAANDLYGMCRLLYDAACQIAPVDAFYLCQYDAQTQSLHFPFNFDEEKFDPPVTLPLGNGPTSQVIRTGQPYRFPEPDQIGRGMQDSGVTFGNPDKRAETALHLPLLDRRRAPAKIYGVISAQSYQSNAFDALFEKFLTCLAERAVSFLISWDARRGLEESLLQARHSAREIARQQVVGLERIARDAEEAQKLVPLSSPTLRDALTNLRQMCYRLQTGANVLPLRLSDASASSAPPLLTSETTGSPLLERLSPREAEVAQLIAQGRTNKQISEQLTVSEHTVKSQVRNILSKLEIANRAQVASLLAQTIVHHSLE